MQSLTFHDYSPARFEALKAALAMKGLNLTGNQGQVKEFGADVFFSYADNVLSVTVQSAPHFKSMSGFCDELTKVVNAVPVAA